MLQDRLSSEAGRVEDKSRDGQGLWQAYLCVTFLRVLSLPFQSLYPPTLQSFEPVLINLVLGVTGLAISELYQYHCLLQPRSQSLASQIATKDQLLGVDYLAAEALVSISIWRAHGSNFETIAFFLFFSFFRFLFLFLFRLAEELVDEADTSAHGHRNRQGVDDRESDRSRRRSTSIDNGKPLFLLGFRRFFLLDLFLVLLALLSGRL